LIAPVLLAPALIGLAVATSLLLAATARLPSLVSTLLLAYLAYVANIAVVTLVLSPFEGVTRGGLAVAEGVLCAGALGAWALRGRPRLPVAAARAAFRRAISDPVTALFLLVALLLLSYELVLGLTVPVNNGDALSYHLSRAAAWAQHGGVYWIPQAPNALMNAGQPLAEIEVLFLMVAAGGGALVAVPQFLAQIAILVAVYGASRRLGFEVRAAACATCLFATFSVVALEATTAQNDLVAASFPAVAATLLLGKVRLEWAAAGAAAAFGLGAKLTVGLVLPVLVLLAMVRGRRALVTAFAGGVAGFVAVGMWGYVLNYHYTGQLLGVGTGIPRGSPSYPGSVANAFYLLYGLMDASVLSSGLIHLLALVGGLAAAGIAAWSLRRAGVRRALEDALGVAIPFLAPLLVIGGAGAVAYASARWGLPIRGPNGVLVPVEADLNLEYGRIANENYSAYGPVGIVALVAAAALTIRAVAARRADARHLVLASALPLFGILISLESTWIPFLIRFFVLPAALSAPLLAYLFRRGAASAAYLAVGALAIGVTIAHDQTKPLTSPYGFGRPWNLSQVEALQTHGRNEYAAAFAAYDELIPDEACVGVVVNRWEPSYLLFGPRLQHRVVFLDSTHPLVPQVHQEHLFYVVVSLGVDRWPVVEELEREGWRVEPLGPVWLLARSPAPGAATGNCVSPGS
jgi:hypothetical protein